MNARDFLLGGVAAVALGAGLIAPAGEALADGQGVAVTQSGQKNDAATFYAGNTKTSCTTTQDTVANLTITITPPAGNFVYLTGFYAEVGPNATGAASAVSWASTNLTGVGLNATGGPAWLTLENASAVAQGAQGVAEIYPTGIKSTVAGTPVTITPSATMASAYQCVHAVGYFNPS